MSEVKVIIGIDIGPNLKEVMKAAVNVCEYACDVPKIIQSFDLSGVAKEALDKIEIEGEKEETPEASEISKEEEVIEIPAQSPVKKKMSDL